MKPYRSDSALKRRNSANRRPRSCQTLVVGSLGLLLACALVRPASAQEDIAADAFAEGLSLMCEAAEVAVTASLSRGQALTLFETNGLNWSIPTEMRDWYYNWVGPEVDYTTLVAEAGARGVADFECPSLGWLLWEHIEEDAAGITDLNVLCASAATMPLEPAPTVATIAMAARPDTTSADGVVFVDALIMAPVAQIGRLIGLRAVDVGLPQWVCQPLQEAFMAQLWPR